MVGALSVFLTILVVDLSCANPQWPPHWEHGPAPCPPEAYVPHPPQPAQHPYYPPYSPEPCPLYSPPPPHHPPPPPSPPPPPHPSSYYCPSLSSPHGHVPPPPYSHWPPYQPKPQPGFYSPPHYHEVPAIARGEEDENIFPSDFSFGVGNGAYHIEGASEQDCKGQNIWDHWLLSGGISNIDDYSTGEYASDSYNHILEDIEIFNNLTISHYRFSISWARIIPAGTGTVNQAGINHYKHLIHLLKINQIEPMVTIYHGDLPQALQDQGGMLSPLFTDWYLEYVRVLFENYGDEVKYWFTFSDPISVCERGYSKGNFAPGYTEVYHENAYRCGHNLLLAHAAAYHLYDGCFRPKQQGKISFAIMSRWYEPATDCESDRQAAETKLQFTLGWFMHPIYVGDYPQVMKDRVAWKSQLEGRCESRLPEFTHFEIEYIKNTHDFFSLSYLQWVECTPQSPEVYYLNTCYDDAGVEVIEVPGNNAPGLRKLIHWINVNYHYPSIFVVFNGYGTTSRCLSDWDRIDYIKAVLRQIRWAQIYDCARIYGYTYFSYIDGFEWWRGYTMKYGLYDVDFSCPYKTRTPRESAVYYQNLCRTHHI